MCIVVLVGLLTALNHPGLSPLEVPGVPWHPPSLEDQLILAQPRGADYAHKVILASPDFETFRRPCHPTQRLFKKSEENSSRDSLLQVFLSYSHCPSDKWCLKNRRWIYVCTHEDQIRRIIIWWKKFQKFFMKQIYSCFFFKNQQMDI